MKRQYILYNNSESTFDVKEPEKSAVLNKTRCLMTAASKSTLMGGALYRYEYNNDGTLHRRVLLINTPMEPSRPKRREGPRRKP